MKTDFVSLIGALEDGGHPFVLYRYPEENDIHLMIDSSVSLNVVKDLNTDKGFVFAPFIPSVPSVLLTPSVHTVIPANDLPVCDISQTDTPMQDREELMVQRHEYMTLVQDAIREINESDIKKIVTSRIRAISYTAIDTAGVYAAMCQTYPHAMTYYFSHPQIGRWMGASPELLVFRSGDSLHTMSLAGTQPYEGEKTYRWTEKEVEEQEIVTRYIRQVLSAHGVEKIQVKGPENHRAAGVIHLCSHISGTLSHGADMKELLAELSPTPALCGYPKDSAMAFLSMREKHRRSFYGGYMGEINMTGDKSMELFVNLRCMQIKDTSLLLYAGGGITSSSDPAAEWEETCHKMKTMERVIAPYIYPAGKTLK